MGENPRKLVLCVVLRLANLGERKLPLLQIVENRSNVYRTTQKPLSFLSLSENTSIERNTPHHGRYGSVEQLETHTHTGNLTVVFSLSGRRLQLKPSEDADGR